MRRCSSAATSSSNVPKVAWIGAAGTSPTAKARSAASPPPGVHPLPQCRRSRTAARQGRPRHPRQLRHAQAAQGPRVAGSLCLRRSRREAQPSHHGATDARQAACLQPVKCVAARWALPDGSRPAAIRWDRCWWRYGVGGCRIAPGPPPWAEVDVLTRSKVKSCSATASHIRPQRSRRASWPNYWVPARTAWSAA